METAERRARASDDPQLFMLAFAMGRACAADGGDDHQRMRDLPDPAWVAGFIEGMAAHRARTAKPRDYVKYSVSHAKAVAS
ncbi:MULTISPECIES: hypothetical protein [unclassified Streptomyces]|uniref:hypothetical protein n=1 Tax=unclassified Streptomyces TaxID=2593676 RepID=UPI0033FAE9FC